MATDAWTEVAEGLLESGRVDGLDLNYAKGFKDINLEFVRDWPLKRLTVLARTVSDLAPISRLAETVESLSVQTAPSATLDVSAFPRLTSLAAEWSQVRLSIATAGALTDLLLRSYREVDLVPLQWNSRLRRLRFKDRPSLQTLTGVGELHELEHLGVYLAPLRDIEDLRDIQSELLYLHIELCRIGDLGPVSGLSALRMLNAGDCGGIRSVAPLRNLQNLRVAWLFGSTNVLDHDLSALVDLPALEELRMQSRQSYRPSVGFIHSLIAERGTALRR
ncbi:MAG TPA: hypothetical protein VMS99_11815 [Acidimicrobiia bacterium]|nr:hypothetical protein [Acidimicrobiia bacterium]